MRMVRERERERETLLLFLLLLLRATLTPPLLLLRPPSASRSRCLSVSFAQCSISNRRRFHLCPADVIVECVCVGEEDDTFHFFHFLVDFIQFYSFVFYSNSSSSFTFFCFFSVRILFVYHESDAFSHRSVPTRERWRDRQREREGERELIQAMLRVPFLLLLPLSLLLPANHPLRISSSAHTVPIRIRIKTSHFCSPLTALFLPSRCIPLSVVSPTFVFLPPLLLQ